jgi:gliding motility-associated-like protein
MPNYNSSSQSNQTISVWPDSTSIYYASYDSNNCSLVDSFEVVVNTYPEIEALSPINAYVSELVTLDVIGGTQWEWSPSLGLSCTSCQNPELIAIQDQTYLVSSDNIGCIIYDTVQIFLLDAVLSCGAMPTAFSPNIDGRNDKFSLVDELGAISMLNLKIYNRWGELIHDSPEPWDGNFKGEPQCACTYVYVIEYLCYGNRKVESGNVTLIR